MNLIVRCLAVPLWPYVRVKLWSCAGKKLAIHNIFGQWSFSRRVEPRRKSQNCRKKSPKIAKKIANVLHNVSGRRNGENIMIEDGINWIKMDRNTETDNKPKGLYIDFLKAANNDPNILMTQNVTDRWVSNCTLPAAVSAVMTCKMIEDPCQQCAESGADAPRWSPGAGTSPAWEQAGAWVGDDGVPPG